MNVPKLNKMGENDKRQERTVKRPAFYFDTQICTGCKTCVIACQDKNDLGTAIRWRRVVEYSGGEWLVMSDGSFKQDVFAYYISVSCNHCEEPICVEVCPTTAMHQDDSGIVAVDQSKCMGCGYCEWACPYSAPQYQANTGQISKCDFCRSEIETGGTPACVAACPTRALLFDDLDRLEQRSSRPLTTAPLPEFQLTKPGVIFKPHQLSKPVESTSGQIANPEEIKNA